MYSNSHNHLENNYSNKNQRFVTENKSLKSIINYNTDRIKQIASDTQQTTDELSRLDLPAGVDIEVKL